MIVGLTGGIGSGKTTVAKVFEAMGCIIYNSDERAKTVYFQEDVKNKVIHLLGKQAYIDDKTIDKQFIGEHIFSDKKIAHELNAIIHPAVKVDFEDFSKNASPQTIIIKETALLFEENINKQVAFSVLVTAPTEIKIQRVMTRSHLQREEVEKRLLAQWTDVQKLPLAQFVIVNDGIQPVIPQVTICIQKIKEVL